MESALFSLFRTGELRPTEYLEQKIWNLPQNDITFEKIQADCPSYIPSKSTVSLAFKADNPAPKCLH